MLDLIFNLILGGSVIIIVIWSVSIFVRLRNLYRLHGISRYIVLDSAEELQVKKLEKEMPNFNRLCLVMILFTIYLGVSRDDDKKKRLEKTAVEKTCE